MHIQYLDDEDCIIVNRALARAVGLNTSIFLRRLRFWLKHNEHERKLKEVTHYRDDRWWSWNTYQEWADDFEIFSVSTVRRTISAAEELGIVWTEGVVGEVMLDRPEHVVSQVFGEQAEPHFFGEDLRVAVVRTKGGKNDLDAYVHLRTSLEPEEPGLVNRIRKPDS